MRSRWIAAVVCVLLAAGCAMGENSPPAPPPAAASLVVRWMQGQGHDYADLVAAVPQSKVVVLSTDGERAAFRRRAPSLETVALGAVDLSANVVVLGGYPNCQAASHLEVDRTAHTVTFVVERDEKVTCVWAPYTVDAWALPREDLGEDPANISFRR